jgi:hypothetical protein
VKPGFDSALWDLFVRGDLGDGLAEIARTDDSNAMVRAQR